MLEKGTVLYAVDVVELKLKKFKVVAVTSCGYRISYKTSIGLPHSREINHTEVDTVYYASMYEAIDHSMIRVENIIIGLREQMLVLESDYERLNGLKFNMLHQDVID